MVICESIEEEAITRRLLLEWLRRMDRTAIRLSSKAPYKAFSRQMARDESTCARIYRANLDRGRAAIVENVPSFSKTGGTQSSSCTTATAPSVRSSSPVAFSRKRGITGRGALCTDSTQPAKVRSRTILSRSTSIAGCT